MRNFFELFNLPVGFIIDKEQMIKKYYELSTKYHPDHHHSSRSDMTEVDILRLSSDINQAKVIFLDKQKTIEYLLTLKGVLSEGETKLPLDFLADMMEVNENLAEAKLENEKEKLEQINKKILNYQLNLDGEMDRLIREYALKEEYTILEKIKICYLKNKYLQRITDSI